MNEMIYTIKFTFDLNPKSAFRFEKKGNVISLLHWQGFFYGYMWRRKCENIGKLVFRQRVNMEERKPALSLVMPGYTGPAVSHLFSPYSHSHVVY